MAALSILPFLLITQVASAPLLSSSGPAVQTLNAPFVIFATGAAQYNINEIGATDGFTTYLVMQNTASLPTTTPAPVAQPPAVSSSLTITTTAAPVPATNNSPAPFIATMILSPDKAILHAPDDGGPMGFVTTVMPMRAVAATVSPMPGRPVEPLIPPTVIVPIAVGGLGIVILLVLIVRTVRARSSVYME